MENASNTPSLRFRGYTDAWGQERLGDLGEVITGSTPSTSHPEYYSNDGLPWVTPTDINGPITGDSPRRLSKEGEKVARIVPPETILITCIASIGKNTILDKMGSFNQQINALVPNKSKTYPYFLLTESELWSNKMKASAAAGTMQIVNKNEFSNLNTMVPSLPEQRKIGTFFSEIDDLLSLHQRKLDKLQAIKKSLLQKMFPAEGEDRPQIRFAGYTDAWGQERLGDICSITKGSGLSKENLEYEGANKCVLYGHLYTDYGFFIKDVHWGTNVLPDNPIYSEVGDVLVPGSDTTPTGCARAASIDVSGVLLGGDINVFKHSDNIDGDFLSLSINHERPAMISMIKGTSVRHLTGKDLRDLAVKFPKEVKEQRCISSVFIKLDSLLSLHQRKLEKLQEIKKALLQKMFC